MDNEIWKIYKVSKAPYKRVYEVSNLGRVKINGEIVKPLYRGDKCYLKIGTFHIHRAVAELFIPNPDNKPQVDHINTNRHDNRACNLRWVTAKENGNNDLTLVHLSASHIGLQPTEETKRKLKAANSGENNGFYGIHHSEETKDKIRNTLKDKALYTGKHWKVIDGKRVWY